MTTASAMAPRVAGAYALATFATMMWGANSVIARAVAGEVSPLLATWLRLSISSIAIVLILGRRLPAAWPQLRAQWKLLTAMGLCGMVAFNNLMYVAAHHTSASNIAVVQGAIPVFVLLGGALLFGERLRAVQLLGAALGGLGIVGATFGAALGAPASGGQLWGDLLAVVAMAFYAGFVLGVRRRQGLDAALLFGVLSVIGWLLAAPLAAWEVLQADFVAPTAKGLLLVVVSGLAASFAAQFAFLHAVDRLGPARAGLFMNLIPLFGVAFAALLLREAIGGAHLAGLALVLGGIVLVERAARRV